ncbi:MAG TPA: ferritin-like domain-containing protein [Streptosporangiaceae bacterium]|jgi:hypothetical protein
MTTRVSNNITPVKALQTALAAEHAAVYGYGVVGAHGGDAYARAANRDWNVHRDHRDQLIALLQQRHAQPVGSRAGYALPFNVSDPKSAARLAAHLEDGVAAAYLQVVAVTDTKLRSFGARMLRDATLRGARWGGSTAAFPGMDSAGS